MSESEFFRAYIECALWASTDDDGDNLERDFTIDNIAPATLDEMRKDCEDFQECNAQLLEQAYATGHYEEAQAGHDFWLTRNRHGAGFWDRGLDDIGAALTREAHAYGSADLYVGDDGLIYQM